METTRIASQDENDTQSISSSFIQANEDKIELSDLEDFFDRTVKEISLELSLIEDGNIKMTVPVLNSAQIEMAEVKKEVKNLNSKIDEWKGLLSKANKLHFYMQKKSIQFDEIEKNIMETPLIAKQLEKDTKVPCQETRSKNQDKQGLKETKNQKKSIPSISYLTTQEFDQIPKYMKGRFTYHGINGAIDEFNQALKTKYEFYLRGFQAMASLKDKKLYKEMKSLETRETRGLFFLTSDDLKSAGTLKTETHRRNVSVILRHCQRIREIRGPGPILRFVVIS